MRRNDRLRQLVDRLQSPIMTWFIRLQGARAVVGDPRRGHPLRDGPSWRQGQDHVFRLGNLAIGRHNAVLHLQLVRDSRYQLVVAASAAPSSNAVVEPGPA